MGPPHSSIKLKPFNIEQQDLLCQTFQLTCSSVTTMLSKLKWTTLHHRRHILKLTMLYKILHNLVELHLPNYITYNTSITRGHEFKLSIPFSRINAYKHSFFPSTIPKWNNLPAAVVRVRTAESFINLLWHCTTLTIWVLAIINIIIIIDKQGIYVSPQNHEQNEKGMNCCYGGFIIYIQFLLP